MSISSICVFCGARDNVDDTFKTLAYECGKKIAEHKLRLVYGGGGSGLMGLACLGAHENGAKVTGIYPKFMNEREPLSQDLDEAIIVDDMFERKKIMIAKADAFIVLPGGVGTLDEIFEVITLKTLGRINHPIIFINQNGYWNTFNPLLQQLVDHNFAKADVFDVFRMVSTLDEAFAKLGV